MKAASLTLLVFALSFQMHGKILPAPESGQAEILFQGDSSLVNLDQPEKKRRFTNQRLEQFRSQDEFYYAQQRGGRPTLWDRFKLWLGNFFRRILANPNSIDIIQIIIYSVILIAFVFTLLKLFNVDPFRVLRKKDKAIIPHHIGEENIHEMNFEAEIEQAIAASHWRLAIRLYYLQALKALSDQGILHWSPSKTNTDYVHEISQSDLRRSFQNLGRLFEFIWYGHFDGSRDFADRAKGFAREIQAFEKDSKLSSK